MILVETERRNQDREMQIDTSSRTYILECDDANVGDELEIIAVSRKPFRELSCSSNIRTNVEPESDSEILSGLVCVKIRDDIHKPVESTGQTMALKNHVKARYRL